MIKLYEHQKQGRDLLLEHKKYCLFFEVGTGKTYTALSALRKLPHCKVLIVAPKRVLESVWKKDTEFDLSGYDVTYMNYEKIARDKTFTRNYYDVVILDEVHKLKGKSTKTSKKFRVINTKAKYVWGLTGTPVANSYADVYNIFKNMNIVEFDMDYDEFVWTYYITRTMDSPNGYKFDILIAPKAYRVDELMSRIEKHSLTKRAKDCIDLPDKRFDLVYVDGMYSDKYKELKKGLFITEDYEKNMIDLEKINKLHQASNGFVYDFYKNPIEVCDNKKLKLLEELLEDVLEETERVVVVYYYKHDLDNLRTLPFKYTTDPDKFENNQILFLQYGQAEGLNLQHLSHQMIFYSYDYSFLKFDQICGRIYRNGQKNNCVYTMFISKNTIEEEIWDAIKHKKSTDEFLKSVLGGKNAK